MHPSMFIYGKLCISAGFYAINVRSVLAIRFSAYANLSYLRLFSFSTMIHHVNLDNFLGVYFTLARDNFSACDRSHMDVLLSR